MSSDEVHSARTHWYRDALLMGVIVIAYCIVEFFVAERIGVNGGQGWDGLAYTQWAREFWPRVVDEGLTRFHSQRILPSAIVHYGLTLAGAKLSVANVITAFMILNTVVLTASAVVWGHLGHALKLRRPVVWVGFIALFASHANLKHALYYPTLTDPTAFCFGMLLVWGYVAQRPAVIWLTSIASVFTWPALPAVGIALLVFPRAKHPISVTERWRSVRIGVSIALSLAFAVGFLLVARHYMLDPVRGVGDEKFAAWVLRDWLWLTMPLLGSILALGLYTLIADRSMWRVDDYVRAVGWKRILLGAIAASVIVVVRAFWVEAIGRRGAGPSEAQFLCEHTLAAIRGPLWGPVHHVVYFGPIVLVGAMCWRRVARTVNEWGPSAVLGLAFVVAFAAGSNSRQWNHLVPLFVVVAVCATRELWNTPRAIMFGALTIAWSKIWFTLAYDRPLHWHEFPNQRYFMHHGPYSNNTMFVVHLVAAAVTLGLLYWLLGNRAPSTQKLTTELAAGPPPSAS